MENIRIAGTYYQITAKDIESLEVTTTLQLKGEFDNVFDANAVSLWYGDIKIGYLPKECNQAFAYQLRNCKSFTAVVTALDSETLRIYIDIFEL